MIYCIFFCVQVYTCVCSSLKIQRSIRRYSSGTVVVSAVVLCGLSCNADSASTRTYSTVPPRVNLVDSLPRAASYAEKKLARDFQAGQRFVLDVCYFCVMTPSELR